MSDEEYIEVTCLEDTQRRYVAGYQKGTMVKTYSNGSWFRPLLDQTPEILKQAKIGTILLIALVLSLGAFVAQLVGVL